MKKIYLDKEEREILNAIDRGEFEVLPMTKKERERLKKIAKNTVAKSRAISIRISQRDLVKIRARAMREGMPYQTLISSIIHKEAEKQ